MWSKQDLTKIWGLGGTCQHSKNSFFSPRWEAQNPKLQVLKTPFWPSTRNLNLNEDYFVAKIERKAKTLDEAGMYSAQPYQKNDWIVYVRWYIFSPNKTNNGGDRFYSRGDAQWIPCNSIIRNLKEQVTLSWSSRYYKLSKSLHTHIEEHGDLAY